MKKVAIAFVVIGLVILIMSSIRITIPMIISNSALSNLNTMVNITPGTTLIISNINGALRLIQARGYSGFINMINYLSPLFVFIGMVVSIALFIVRRSITMNLSDPFLLGTILMLALSLIFALPIPTPIYISDGYLTNVNVYMLVGINAYVGFASVMYLISTILLIAGMWLYREPQLVDDQYLDIDQLTNMTVILKSEEETERSE
ncbi:MAG: hypothetical protein TU36_001790 [Vulcanisaeta sp. AZ3]